MGNINKEIENKPSANLEDILKENDLSVVEGELLSGKKTAIKAIDSDGKEMVLKFGRIENDQIRLMRKADELQGQICFRSPRIIKEGNGWALFEYIEGENLNNLMNTDPDKVSNITYKISQDYKKLIKSAGISSKNLLDEGRKWTFSKLYLWAGPLIGAGLCGHKLIENIADDFDKAISKKGADFFEITHNNIIGDHIILKGDDIYLLDLNHSPRPGKDYYGFLRGLDHMFLKRKDCEKAFSDTIKFIDKYLADKDREEVKLVFALRTIGILGWDIIYNQTNSVGGDIEQKKQLALKFIKREY